MAKSKVVRQAAKAAGQAGPGKRTIAKEKLYKYILSEIRTIHPGFNIGVKTGARGREIGVHAVRGGTVAGEHRALFFGEDETLEFRHSAASRRIFAAGAVRALDFAVGRAPGLYRVDDVLGLNDIRGGENP